MTMSKRSISPLLLILALLSSASALTACGASTPSSRAPINLPALTPEVRKVHKPVVIPDGVLDQQGTEKLWGRDRASLVQCEAGKAVLVNYNDVLSVRLAGAKQ